MGGECRDVLYRVDSDNKMGGIIDAKVINA